MDFRQRLEQARVHPISGNPPDPDTEIAFSYYATERGHSPACLDLRQANGRRTAIPYSFITEIRFDTDLGIELVTMRKQITITGRNLIALYESLVAYRVRYVQADLGGDAQEDGLFVDEISIEDL